MNGAHRIVFTNGRTSHLLAGDPEWNAERFQTQEDGSRFTCALPVLLAEGWTVVSVTPLARQARPEDDYGCTLVVLARPG